MAKTKTPKKRTKAANTRIDGAMAAMKKNSSEGGPLKDHRFYKSDTIPTSIPILNLALSGSFKGGFSSRGITMFAGPSKHFKTIFGIILCEAFQKFYADGIIEFFDSEGGAKNAFETFGVDVDRVFASFPKTLEEFGTTYLNQLKTVGAKFNYMAFVDSIGMMSTQHAMDIMASGSDKTDMFRAKILRQQARAILPYMLQHEVPACFINHVYSSMDQYKGDQLAGGQGLELASDSIFVLGKRKVQDKEKELLGNEFVVTVNKSRYIREGVKFPVKVTYNEGIDKYSSIFELGRLFGAINVAEKADGTGESKGWYNVLGDGAKLRRSDIEGNPVIMEDILANEQFNTDVHNKYVLQSHDQLEFDPEAELAAKMETLDKIDEANEAEDAAEES